VLVALVAARAAAFDAKRCTEFVEQGYCTQPKTAQYMATHCASYCHVESQAATTAEDEGGEDPSCEQWKASGYCDHEQYADYMQRACPKACGISNPSAAAGQANPDAPSEDEPAVASTRYESEFDETGTEIIDDPPATPPSEPEPQPPAADGPDNENCVAWAKQGLCESDDYKEYMALNCKRTCADPSSAVAAAASASSATEPTPANCLMWAKRGMCGEASDYRQYMEMNCAETCANIEELLKGELPPNSFVPLLLAVGFIALLGYAGKEALERDAARSAKLGKSWRKVGTNVGEEEKVGPGRPNTFKSTKKEKVPASLKAKKS